MAVANNPVTKDLTPDREALVAGQNHGALLIATADELEEQVGSRPINGEVWK